MLIKRNAISKTLYKMKIEDRLKELIKEETGVDVNVNSRKKNVIETRALYFKLLKENNPVLTLENMGETVNKDYSTVIYSLKKYSIYEKYNPNLKQLKKEINSKIYSENIIYTFDNEQLRIELKKSINKIESLEIQLQEKELELINISKTIFNFSIISELNDLLTKTKGTEKYDLINLRLNAFYDMNKIKTI